MWLSGVLSHRIYQLTTEGKFIGTFGEYGSAIGQFNHPNDVKISPSDKVYVSDGSNHRVQVFNPDWSISHFIDGTVSGDDLFSTPQNIAFDLSGNIHVAGYGSPSIAVFDSKGQFIRHYDDKHINAPYYGIAIDPSGYCLVINSDCILSVFDSKGTFVNAVGGFNHPYGVTVSPVDGSVWVADTFHKRLVQY